MLRLECYIRFEDDAGKYLDLFNAHEIEIESSWKQLTGLCKITLARKYFVKFKNGNQAPITDIIRRGTKVKVWLGYNGDLQLEFSGYVARIDVKAPFSVECEDEMWKLKQTSFSKAWRSTTVGELVGFIYSGKINVVDFQIGAFRIDRASAAAVLDKLQSEYRVYSYFTYDDNGGPILNVGLGGYDFKTKRPEHIYSMMANVVENNLTFRSANENKIRVTATSIGKNGVVIKAQAKQNDTEGEVIEMPTKRNLSQTALQELVDREFQTKKFDGYKGSITSFGEPHAQHNDTAVIQDPEYPEREGSYVIDKVKTSFGTGGFRRLLDLGLRVK